MLHGRLSFAHGALQIAPLDAVLHSDVARIIFAINKRRAVSLRDGGKLAERNLLSIRRADQQIADLVGAAAELRLHADDQIEQLFALNDLRGGLSADGGRDHGFHVGDVDSVAGDLVAIHIDQQAGLAKFADYREFGKTGDFGQHVLDLDRLVLQDIQVLAIDFDGQRTLEAGQSLVDRVFRGLSVVKDDSGKGVELLVDGCDQFFLVADLAAPGLSL